MAGILDRYLQVLCTSGLKPASGSDTPTALFKGLGDKATRTAVHSFFRDLPALPPFASDTVTTEDGQQAVRVLTRAALRASVGKPDTHSRSAPSRAGCTGGEGRKRKRAALGDIRGLDEAWEGGRGRPHTRCILYKVNRDSHAAVAALARRAGGTAAAFGVAGTKDKRGATAQWLTAYRIPAARLRAAAAGLLGVRVAAVGYAPHGLRLGDLAGNVFTITLRDVRVPGAGGGRPGGAAECVAAAVAGLRDLGFINYFGLQRFGSGPVPTHEIGFRLLRGDWAGAVSSIMAGPAEATPPIRDGLEAFARRDYTLALRALPGHMVAERAILKGYVDGGPEAHLAALQRIPRHLRTMYLHAAQSFIWNAAATARVGAHGASRVIAGDLVVPGSPWPDGGGACDPLKGAGCAVAGGTAGEAREAWPATAAARIACVHRVTDEDVTSGRFTVEEVVLPLPGHGVVYPSVACAATADGVATGAAAGEEFYNGLARRLDVPLASSPHGARDFSVLELSGDYRRLLARPRALRHLFVRHSSLDDDIVAVPDAGPPVLGRPGAGGSAGDGDGHPTLGPAERLSEHGRDTVGAQGEAAGIAALPGAPLAREGAVAGGEERGRAGLSGPVHDARGHPDGAVLELRGGGALLSLVLSFALPASTYATMLVRELMKGGTGASEHKAASAAHQAGAATTGAATARGVANGQGVVPL